MALTARAVVIGGGIGGASTLYYLTQHGSKISSCWSGMK